MSAKDFKCSPGWGGYRGLTEVQLRSIIQQRIDIEMTNPTMTQYKEVIWNILDVEKLLHSRGWLGVALMTRQAADAVMKSGSVAGLEQEHTLDRAVLWKEMKAASIQADFDPIKFIEQRDRSITMEKAQHSLITKKTLRAQFNPVIGLHISQFLQTGIVKPTWSSGRIISISRDLTTQEVLDWFHTAQLPSSL